MKRQILKTIELNPTESQITNLLVDFTNHYNQNGQEKPLELRITGGWVRDKLLGKESNDLDIAINVLSGEEFALKLLAFAAANNVDLGKNATSLHTIKKNPEKLKHLETCTTKLFGLDIDFVNLRNEQYTEDSRVPIIECGTAEEDALRRDATLNALFYNLNLGKIEDLTGQGLADLENGILRTPLQPLQTFLDDPLRVLRLVRFASRFNFVIDSETLDAMMDDRIRSTLVHKISRERVGVEMDKILTSGNVEYGLRLINYVGLTDSIFSSGVLSETIEQINEESIVRDIRGRAELTRARVDQSTQTFTKYMEALRNGNSPQLSSITDDVLSSSQKLFWLCIALQQYSNIRVKINTKKFSFMSYVEVILKEGLRFGKTDYDPALSIVDKLTSDQTLHKFFQDRDLVSRSDLGMYIRQFGGYFKLNLAVAAFNDVLTQLQVADQRNVVPSPEAVETDIDSGIVDKVSAHYESLLNTITELNLQDVSAMKPLVDGKMISKFLGKKPGPWMSAVTTEVLRWQLDQPQGTQDECLDHIKEVLEEN